MAGKANGADDLEDPGLAEEAEREEGDGQDDAGLNNEGKEPKDKKKGEPSDDIEVVLEEETEADLEAREKREEAAVDEGRGEDEERDEREDPKTQYSKDVRARIAREQRIAREATARATAANQRVLVAEAKSRAAQKEALEVTGAALESHAKTTRALLAKAKEDGKTDDEIRLQEELDKLNRRGEAVVEAKKNVEREEEEAKRGGAADAAPNQLALEWKGRNKWFNDPRFAEQSEIVRIMDRKMKNVEGYDPNTSEYFDELDRRIKRRLPEMQRYMEAPRRQSQDRERPAPRRDPTGGVRRGDGPQGGAAARKGTVILTKSEQENMVNFGLDPKDKKHQREYALQKQQGGKS